MQNTLSDAEKLEIARTALHSLASAITGTLFLLKTGNMRVVLLTLRQARERTKQILELIKE